MPMFTKKPVTIEARQLVGTAGETMQVADWVRENGYPWLLGDATRPDTLVPETTPAIPGAGLWIDPATGELVIRTLEGGPTLPRWVANPARPWSEGHRPVLVNNAPAKD